MTEREPLDELPEPLQQTLRGLGGVSAPAELWERVELARVEPLRAPAELWQRVAPAVAEEAARRATGGRHATGGRLLRFPARRLLSTAAVLAVAISAAILLQRGASDGPLPALAAQLPEQERAAFLRRIVVRDVPVEQLSSGARAFAAVLGDGEDA